MGYFLDRMLVMTAANKLEQLEVWTNAKDLVTSIYRTTSVGPSNRDFSYRDQIRSAAVSVMSNIAEGYGRSTDKEFARFLDIARGSGLEVQSLLYVGSGVEYLDEATFRELYRASDQVIAQITSLRRYLLKG